VVFVIGSPDDFWAYPVPLRIGPAVTARPVRVQAAADIAATTTHYVPKSFKRMGVGQVERPQGR
jgi:hypothetical protein